MTDETAKELYQTTDPSDAGTYLRMCRYWHKDSICNNRVVKPGLDYCEKHQKYEGTDLKTVEYDDETPTKDKRVVIPGVAKSKPTAPAVPKMKPRTLLPSLTGAGSKDNPVDLAATPEPVKVADRHRISRRRGDLSNVGWGPARNRSKRVTSDDEDDDHTYRRSILPSFPPMEVEVPDTPPEEHSAPKPPPAQLCTHKELKWSYLDRYLCFECGGCGVDKSQDHYETCSKYYECEPCKNPKPKPEKKFLRSQMLVCEQCKKNVLFLGSDGTCEQCERNYGSKCPKCGEEIATTDGVCNFCYIEATKTKAKPPAPGSFLEMALKDADRDKGVRHDFQKCFDALVWCRSCGNTYGLPAPEFGCSEVFKTSPPRIIRPIKVSMTPTPVKKPSFMSPTKPRRAAKQDSGWCFVCCGVYSLPHHHTDCPATLSPGKALAAPVIEDEEDLVIPSPSKYFKMPVVTTVTSTTSVSTMTSMSLPELPSQGGACDNYEVNKKSKVKDKCKCGFYKDEHHKMDTTEDKGGKAFNMPKCSKHFNHLHRLIKFTRSDEPEPSPTPEELQSPRTKTVKPKGKTPSLRPRTRKTESATPTQEKKKRKKKRTDWSRRPKKQVKKD